MSDDRLSLRASVATIFALAFSLWCGLVALAWILAQSGGS